MIATPCLGWQGRCPDGAMASLHGRCNACRSRKEAQRNAKPSRAIYKGGWRATSRAARQEQGWCSLCYGTQSLTLDHTTGMVVCRSCHPTEANGGVTGRAPAYAARGLR